MIYDIGNQLQGRNEPIFCIQSHAHFDTLDAGESVPGLPGWPLEEVTNDNTYGGYSPELPDTGIIAFDFGGPGPCDTVCIGAHTLGTHGCTVRLYFGDGSPVVWDDEPGDEVFEITPADDSPIIVVFPPVTRRWARLDIGYATLPVVGVVRIGQRLQMPNTIYGGHTPVTLARVTAIRPQVSETGQFIGQAAVRHGLRSSFSLEHLPADWYRTHFDPFVAAARYRSFFAAWRPTAFPNEVVYARVPGEDIAPTNMGVADLMAVTVPIEAHDWEAVT